MSIKFYDKVVDRITGLEGTVVARTERATGAISWEVQPLGVQANGFSMGSTWINEKHLSSAEENKFSGFGVNEAPIKEGNKNEKIRANP